MSDYGGAGFFLSVFVFCGVLEAHRVKNIKKNCKMLQNARPASQQETLLSTRCDSCLTCLGLSLYS